MRRSLSPASSASPSGWRSTACYRSREEVEERRHHDPIERFATYLVDGGITDRAALQSVHDEVKTQVESAIKAAWDAPDPDPATATRHVFAEGEA